MRQSTAHPPEVETRPLDLSLMRETAQILLGPDAAPDAMPPAASELDTLTGTLRGHLELLAPEVEQVADRYHEDSIPRYCALACIAEVRGKLRAEPGPGLSGAAAYARRLARVLSALCDHYENLLDGLATVEESDDAHS
ncbi:DUF6415 family natural product biosynthesis protein [Streptomyces albicerus]|uniref:DUF6415 family natural product biosynthesis protein n=1 Tax=Streptomyces albicerus TaxID=2569859 RepID=UPI00124B9EE3|nr:DUF6415 family natural product biosynthesis protein [Streptomyces albicerus]